MGRALLGSGGHGAVDADGHGLACRPAQQPPRRRMGLSAQPTDGTHADEWDGRAGGFQAGGRAAGLRLVEACDPGPGFGDCAVVARGDGSGAGARTSAHRAAGLSGESDSDGCRIAVVLPPGCVVGVAADQAGARALLRRYCGEGVRRPPAVFESVVEVGRNAAGFCNGRHGWRYENENH